MAKKKAAEGHAAHTKDAENQLGLSGTIERPLKFTMVGAGSMFCPRLMNDVLSIPGLGPVQFALVDIDKRRLNRMLKLGKMLMERHGRDPEDVTGSAQRRDVLSGTDYLVNSIEFGGVDCVRAENDIPAKYGVNQCIGDTAGPGGIFKALRTAPHWLGILKDAEELCPRAIVLNYTNPMNLLCLVAGRASTLPVVGLCHSVQGTSHLLARRAGVPYEEMDWECAGINHLAWFTKLEHKGKDLYPKLMRLAKRDVYGTAKSRENSDIIRKDMMLHFGAFVTESSGHFSEYLPYYRKRKDLIKKYCRARYDGQTNFYADEWPTWRKNNEQKIQDVLAGKQEMKWGRSWEYASWIVEAREKDSPFRIHGNVMNKHRGGGPLISNLPEDGCVEVACMIDRNGINPTVYGKLPPQMAALCDSNMRMFELGAQAVLEKSIDAAIHAVMLDPHTASVCCPAEIKKMVLELFKANKKYLPGYK